MSRSILPLVAAYALLLGCSGGAPPIALGGSDGGGEDSGGRTSTSSGLDLRGGSTSISIGNQGGNAGSSNATHAVCGNGALEGDETCDDANTTPGDGCSGICRVESGYTCPVAGELCQSDLYCGDGLAGPDEGCDDGNQASGDGCSTACQVEEGYTCGDPGELCTPTEEPAVCGNATVDYGETCDDGQSPPVSGDGCSSTCQLEEGWLCTAVGEACEKNEYCGDGVQSGTEACDDGNLRAGDCCSSGCTLEANCVCVTPDPALVPPHQICSSTIACGDGVVGPGELCDDGNTVGGDGCVENCTSVEPGYQCPTQGGACTAIVEGCGNTLLDLGEECDDGNQTASDGCSANCKLEPGWLCPTAGQPCQPRLYCGDGAVTFTRGELCDDGGAQDGDGCSASCRIESGWACDAASPSTCWFDVVCGDKRIRGAETCDDGNVTSADGCSDVCQREDGWVCPAPGVACRPECGDGVLLGREECDDGNTLPDDGCSPTCQYEDGWVCTAGACRRTVCGDGTREGSEACDDGNTRPFDGCSPICVNEPKCGTATSAIGACTSTCGDGILLRGGGEICDDGNNLDGDGCSADCSTIEPGFVCNSPYEAPPASIDIPIVYRDFQQYYAATETAAQIGNPDFGTSCCGNQTGIVQTLLDANRKPVYAGTDAAPIAQTSGKTAFDQWYREVEGINLRFDQMLTLTQQADGSFSMNTDTDEPFFTRCGFYPLEDAPRLDANTSDPVTYTSDAYDDDGDPDTAMVTRTCYAGDGWGFGEEWLNHNYLFTSELRYWFEYQGGETLDFSGDDDVWVFVNGKLAVDLGGVHGKLLGSVTLTLGADGLTNATYALTKGQIYEVVLFQAERWCCGSNYWLTLSNFASGASTCVPDCGDGILTGNEACDLGRTAEGVSLNTGEYGGCMPDCTLAPFCGDSVVSGAEECDDGSNMIPYDSTGDSCAPGCIFTHFCGDGELDTTYGELCDAGADNATNAYGPASCTDTCQPGPYCGDGLQNGTEACDEGDASGTPESTCDGSCQIKCGNAVVDAGEECDLGTASNTGAYHGCRSNCTLGPYCGDGTKNAAEACDDGKNDGSYGTCMPDCSLAPYCGDAVLDTAAGELCDLGSEVNSTTAYGAGACTARCRPAPFCGDSTVNAEHGEVCDDGPTNSDTASGACRTDCSGYNAPPANCGNAVVDTGEECDDGASNGTASSPCDQRCQMKCGNGIKEGTEQCDDGVNDGSYGTCMPDCTLGPYCGDSILTSPPEACDLGSENSNGTYGEGTCTLECTLGPYCGDGRTQAPTEACDGQVGCTDCAWDVPR
jgi:fibro-slime domain-containing protein